MERYCWRDEEIVEGTNRECQPWLLHIKIPYTPTEATVQIIIIFVGKMKKPLDSVNS